MSPEREQEYIDITIVESDLLLMLYIIRSGCLRIKEQGNFRALEGPEKKAMELGRNLEELLMEEFKVSEKKIRELPGE
jgi:hypothetical protein